MEVSIVTISYDRKSKERVKEELLTQKSVEAEFENQFIKTLAEGLREKFIFKTDINKRHSLDYAA